MVANRTTRILHLVKEMMGILGRTDPLENVSWRLQGTVFLKWTRPHALDLQLKRFGYKKCMALQGVHVCSKMLQHDKELHQRYGKTR